MSAAAAVEIVAATEADVPEILRLIRALAEYERLAHEVVATEDDLRQHLFGAERHAEVLLARAAGRIRGFALFFHNFSTFRGRPGLYLEDLFVDPEARGQGIGRLLLAALAREAVARGCARFEWSVLDWNASAIGFYERLGARILPDWRICRLTGDALESLAGQGPVGKA